MWRLTLMSTGKLLLVWLSASRAVLADCPNPSYDPASGLLVIPCVAVLDDSLSGRLLNVELQQDRSGKYRFDLNHETITIIDSGEGTETYRVTGYAADGLLKGATVDVSDRQNRITRAITDATGRFAVDLSTEPPYRMRVRGGTVDGLAYQGILEAWCETTECHATPWTTIIVGLMDEYGFDGTEAKLLLADVVGFHDDPFMYEQLTGQPLPAQMFEWDQVRATLNNGAGLAELVAAYVNWLGGDHCSLPANLGLTALPACGGPPPMEEATAPVDSVYTEICGDRDISSIYEELRRYLSHRPNAADTVEGIMKWWLPLRFEGESPLCVIRALEILEMNDCLTRVIYNNNIIYRKKNSC